MQKKMMKEQRNNKEEKKIKQPESSTFDEKTMSSGLTNTIFDWDGLLHRLMGDEDLAKEIINDYLNQIPDNLLGVKKALEHEDLSLVQREAHIIKGASGNVGALSLQDIAEKIEVACEEKDLVKVGSFVSELDTQLVILKNKLTQFKG